MLMIQTLTRECSQFRSHSLVLILPFLALLTGVHSCWGCFLYHRAALSGSWAPETEAINSLDLYFRKSRHAYQNADLRACNIARHLSAIRKRLRIDWR